MNLDQPFFYFIRHGQTDFNAQGIMCGGESDPDLNPVGLKQARLAAETLKTIEFKNIVYSPLQRALQTAQQIAAAQKNQPTMIPLPDLHEWLLGDWNKRPFTEISTYFLSGQDAPQGESREVMDKRVSAALAKILGMPGPTLAVAHGGVWLSMARLLGLEAVRLHNARPIRVVRTGSATQPLGPKFTWGIEPV